MRIAVFGAGGVGAYFGWRLLRAGEDVFFIARGAHLEALSTRGLRMDTLDGQSVLEQVQATDDPSKIGPVDAVLLGVKTWQVAEAANAMRPLIGENTFVAPLLNGVEAPSELARALGREHVLGGLCYIVSLLLGPGHVKHAGLEPRIRFGELDNPRSERAEKLLAAFTKAGVNADIPEDIHAAMWEKFLFIASLSGVAAVTRAPAGTLRSIPESRKMLEEVIAEIEKVARARGIGLKDDAVGATLSLIDNLPAQATTSMQRDIMAGRPSELAAHNGAVMRIGLEVGVQTPVNSFIYSSLLPLELRARGEVEFPLNPT
ncbi:MAG: 2-dehydropantoate 2-reductase [Deltaproteobacteria bacterium]|nr:2-dehydropantoate 2-reductase [Deltaproteobacteria bacterium]